MPKHYVAKDEGCLVFTGATRQEARRKAEAYCCTNRQGYLNVIGTNPPKRGSVWHRNGEVLQR